MVNALLKKGACPWANSVNKELCGFEDLLGLLELLQLSFRLLEFFLFCQYVVAQAVDLVKHDFDRGFLLPRLACGLGWGYGGGCGGGPGRCLVRFLLLLSFVPPLRLWFGLNVGPLFHVSAAGLAFFGVGCRVLCVLIDERRVQRVAPRVLARPRLPLRGARLWRNTVYSLRPASIGLRVSGLLHCSLFLLSELPSESVRLIAQVNRGCLTNREPRDARQKHFEANDVFVETGE